MTGNGLCIGDEAPDFTLRDQFGQDVRLGDFRGRKAVVLRNDQALKNCWLRVRPRGAGKNRDAIGAQLTVASGGRTRRNIASSSRS